MKDVIDDLGMQTEDDGCCIAQIADFCQKIKNIYYAMDVKHKLFETNKDAAPTNNLPRFIPICANNHLYPITDETTRETILKQHSKTGGAIKKYKAKHKFEHKVNNGTETQIYVHCEDMFIYGLLEHIKQQREQAHMAYHVEQNEDTIKRMGNYRIVTSQRGLCNLPFYDQITRLDNIHNGYVKMNKHNQKMGFKWQDDITIDEHESYNDVKITMDTLNLDITKEQEKYKYNGQSTHSLAYDYYTNNYDRQIVSKCSPQVYDVLTSKACMNSPSIELYTDEANFAFDVNKQYTNVLMNCDEFGWAIYMPTDDVEQM